MDYGKIDAVNPAIRIKGIGGEQRRRNPQQQPGQEHEEHEEESHERPHDRVSIASLIKPDAAQQPASAPLVARVKPDPNKAPEEHPHIDTTV